MHDLCKEVIKLLLVFLFFALTAHTANVIDPGAGDAAAATYKTGKAAAKVAKAADKAGDVGKIVNSADNGVDIAKAGKNACKVEGQCFTEGTQIVVGVIYNEEDCSTVYVTESIENIEVGDLVYSYDTLTGEVSQREVTTTFVRESDHLNYLIIVDENGNEQVIETTDSHPFWVVTNDPDLSRAAQEIVNDNGTTLYHENLEVSANGYWVAAKDLREGDVFLGANGELSTLVAQERVTFADGIKVYNFTVDGNHDYFVIAQTGEFGQTSILVHNAKNYEHVLSAEHIKTATKEKDGEITGYNPKTGEPWDHLKETRDAMSGATKQTTLIKRKLAMSSC
ncbi:hypothetical protein FACS1894170_04720 [Planctomycetales bacterium]|nr:hypothetical protein FACS1894170_04720 [Planctomycetales bacterium]